LSYLPVRMRVIVAQGLDNAANRVAYVFASAPSVNHVWLFSVPRDTYCCLSENEYAKLM
jgi:hypothetical protein